MADSIQLEHKKILNVGGGGDGLQVDGNKKDLIKDTS